MKNKVKKPNLNNNEEKLKHDKEIVLEAVKNFPFAPDKLKNDRDIVLAAVMQNPSIKMTDTVLNLTQQNNLKKEDLFDKKIEEEEENSL